MKLKIDVIDLAVVGCLLLLAFGQFDGCSLPGLPSTKVTAVVYTIDDKKHTVPQPIGAALSTLNSKGIVATVDEVDTTNAGGSVPAQYRVSRPAAQSAGLPAVVFMAGESVVRAVSNPTEAQVLEAAP